MLNLGHSPLYRLFCKCLYIELSKFRLFFNYYIHFLHSTIRKQAFIVLTYRKCWHIANPIYSMIFGCTRHSSNKFGSTLIGTKIRSGRMLKKSLQPLNILDKVFTIKNSNKFDSIRIIRLSIGPPTSLSVASTPDSLGSSGRYAIRWSFATPQGYEHKSSSPLSWIVPVNELLPSDLFDKRPEDHPPLLPQSCCVYP